MRVLGVALGGTFLISSLYRRAEILENDYFGESGNISDRIEFQYTKPNSNYRYLIHLSAIGTSFPVALLY